MPPSVRDRLNAPLAAVPSCISKGVKQILACYNITAKYVAPTDPTEVPSVKYVVIDFVAKEDLKVKASWNSASVNASKLLDRLIASEEVSDKTKAELCNGRGSKACLEWKRNYDEMRGSAAASASAELERAASKAKAARTSTGGKETLDEERQRTLDEMGAVSRISTGQAAVIKYLLMQFFSFSVMDNYFFRKFVEALHRLSLAARLGWRALARGRALHDRGSGGIRTDLRADVAKSASSESADSRNPGFVSL